MKPAPASRRGGSARMPMVGAVLARATLALACCGWAGLAVARAGAPGVDAAAVADDGESGGGNGYADFDPSLLAGAGQSVDLSRFEQGNVVFAGIYNVDVYLNQRWVGRMNVRFQAPSPGASATPCVDRKLMDRLGLAPDESAAAAGARLADAGACVAIGELVPGARMHFDLGSLRLDTSVPQAFLGQLPRGYVSPESWDAGMPAALLNYHFNSYRSSSYGHARTNAYLGLNAGLTLGAWHLRQNATVTWQSADAGVPARHRWHNISAYVRRDLPALHATLTLGDSYTDGAVFDSYALRGVQLGTDDRMLPDSRRGYAPVVRGVADTNAQVTVRQNGVQIYQATVAPGPFAITDLYPTGYGGNLDVTVTEADGRRHTFAVPYASVAQLLRPGTTRFDVAAGRLRNPSLHDQPSVIQASVQHGVGNLFTAYAGLQGSQGYAAALLGGAVNTRYGALALDITQAGARIPGQHASNGRSLRVTYSKVLPRTDTSLSVAAYRYSTRGFLSLTDAALVREYARRGAPPGPFLPADVPLIDGVPVDSLLTPRQRAALAGGNWRDAPLRYAPGLLHRRHHFTLTLNQQLGVAAGSLYANASISDYWNRGGSDTQFQVGYNNHWRHLGYSISASRSRGPFGGYDNQYFVSLNLPLGSAPRAPSLSLNLNHSQATGTGEQAILSGTFGADNQFNYGATAAHGVASGYAGSVNAGYRSPWAVLNASYGSGRDYSQASFSASGAVIGHRGGVTFGQPLGDTVALVHAPGAAGAHVTNAVGVRIDDDGYALVPYLTPYSLNTIRLDPRGLPLGVELQATSAQVAPYAGAVVLVEFQSSRQRALIARIQRTDGQPVPFGAQVFDVKGAPLGVVGQGGQALLRGVDDAGSLSVRWQDGAGAAHGCTFAYTSPELSGSAATYPRIQTTCIADGAGADAQKENAP